MACSQAGLSSRLARQVRDGLRELPLLTCPEEVIDRVEGQVRSARWNRLKPRRVDLAISLLRKEKVGFSKAAEIAGMTAGDFDRTLRERRVRWRG